MPVLPNPKRERFAQALAKGLNLTAAHAEAGYSPNRANAHRLSIQDDVRQRVEEIHGVAAAKVAKKLAITKERIADELARLALYDIREAVSWRSNATEVGVDPDTDAPVCRAFNEVQLVDSADLPEDMARAISEVRQTKDGSLTVKMADKRQSLVDLARLLQFDKEKEGDKHLHLHQHDHLHIESPVDEINAKLDAIAERRGATQRPEKVIEGEAE